VTFARLDTVTSVVSQDELLLFIILLAISLLLYLEFNKDVYFLLLIRYSNRKAELQKV
jgi:hypothetical protein